MSKPVRVSKVYGTPETWLMFDSAINEIGWLKTQFIKHVTHAYFKKNGPYYQQCAALDASARGMSETDYYSALYDGEGIDPQKNDLLLPYEGDRPAFGANPLSTVPNAPTGEENARKFNVVQLGDLYYVYLNVGLIVDNGPKNQLFSKMLRYHFDLYWSSIYKPQIQLHENRRFSLPGTDPLM